MKTTLIGLPPNVIDLIKEASDELEVLHDEFADNLTLEVDDDSVDWYFTVVRGQVDEVLQLIDSIEDQIAHRADD